jgi:dTDP-4-dehydrorhamnose reductase
MKILVLGAGGMAGHAITLRLTEKGHSVAGFARRGLPFCETRVGDALTADFSGFINDYDAVVNCIGILNKAVDADPYTGIYLNACLSHLLARLTENTETRIVHLSTDCVFSGNGDGGYKETDCRSADTLYGRSKALGEIDDDKNLTFRTSVVGPDINADGVGLFNWFMKQSGKVSGYTKAIWSGVTTIVLADAIDAALEQNLTGLCHLTNGERIDKRELLRLFNKLRNASIAIAPSDAVNEDRSLVCTRSDFDFVTPSYTKMVADMGRWTEKHKALYPHYAPERNGGVFGKRTFG